MKKRDTPRMCAYCADMPAGDDDHVIARQFLLDELDSYCDQMQSDAMNGGDQGVG